MANRRRFTRKTGELSYKRKFILAVEGRITEPEYFNMFNGPSTCVSVKCLPGRTANSPLSMLKKINEYLCDNNLRKSDEAWIVVDRDAWKESDLNELCAWASSHSNYGLALSNPNFEFWLLLHFEDGNGIATSGDCETRLQAYLPAYDKHVDTRKLDFSMVEQAIERAKRKIANFPLRGAWPTSIGQTTVHLLVEKLLAG